jgi:hypothetical protein
VEDLDFELARATRPEGGRAARVLTIAGALLLVVLVAILLGGMLSVRRMLGTGVRRVTTAVLRDLPDGLSRQRREEIRRRLECVVDEAEAGRLDDRKLGEFTRACKHAVADGRVDAGELREIETRAIALCVAAGGGIR